MGFYPLFLTVCEIIVNSLVECICKFYNALTFKINKSVNSFNFSKEHSIGFAESYRTDKTFIF